MAEYFECHSHSLFPSLTLCLLLPLPLSALHPFQLNWFTQSSIICKQMAFSSSLTKYFKKFATGISVSSPCYLQYERPCKPQQGFPHFSCYIGASLAGSWMSSWKIGRNILVVKTKFNESKVPQTNEAFITREFVTGERMSITIV